MCFLSGQFPSRYCPVVFPYQVFLVGRYGGVAARLATAAQTAAGGGQVRSGDAQCARHSLVPHALPC